MSDRWFRSRVGLVALGLLLAMGVFGCAQDVEDIDRTQPDKVKKKFFEDDASWYFRQTVVDTTVTGQPGYGIGENRRPGYAQRPMWTGQVSRKLKRIKWEIHQNVLYARSTVEPARGVTEQVDGKKHQELGIVAAFPIKSHFDVQRQYNTSTGEPQNVIVENRTDRPWYDREYMRVDWSQNLVTATSSVFSGQAWGLMSPKAATRSSRSLPQKEDRIDPGRTEISKNIVDATSEYVFDPDVVGCIAALGADATWRCEGGTVTVRNFFWRVKDRRERRYDNPKQKNYKPMQYRDDVVLTEKGSNEPLRSTSAVLGSEFLSAKCTKTVNERNRQTYAAEPEERCEQASFDLFGRFGYFRTNVANWSEKRHTYDSGRIQYANRYNIWESMYKEQNGEVVPMKMENREPRPIVYYLNAGYPKEMLHMVDVVEREWDRTFLETVAVAKGYKTPNNDMNDAIAKVKDDLNDENKEKEDLKDTEKQMFVIKMNSCLPPKLAKWRNEKKVDADRRAPKAIFDDYLESNTGNVKKALWEMPVHDRKRLCEELEWATEPRAGDLDEIVRSEEKRMKQDLPFEWQQRGDLRYSFFSWVRELNTGWLGYGPSSADPKTGEIISATANFAGRLLPLIANQGADIVKYLNGEYSRDMIEQGLQVRQQLAGSQGSKSDDQRTQNLEPAMIDGLERKAVDKNVPAEKRPRIDISEYREKLPESDPLGADGKTPQEFGRSIEFVNEAAYRDIKATEQAEASSTKLRKWLERPEIKQNLMSNPMMSQAVKSLAVERGGPGAAKDESRVHQAYLTVNDPMRWEHQIAQRRDMLRKSNVFSMNAGMQMMKQMALLTGTAKRFKGADHEEIANYLRNRAFYGTQLHELGHTFGLRHNYSASLDAMNYHDEFWQFEKLQQTGCGNFSQGPCQDGELTEREARRGGPALAKKLLGEDSNRKYVSKAESRLTSIMEYTAPPRLVGRNRGLGKYDQAAITFAYGRHLQQFEDFDSFPHDLRIDLRLADYFQIASVFGDEGSFSAPRQACRDSNGDVERDCLERGIERMVEDRQWVSIQEAKQHKRKILNTNTRAFKQVYEKQNKLPSNVTKMGNRLVPYNFCTDDRDGRYLGCQSFDWGSNQFEVVSYSIQNFEAMQPFNRYRGSAVGARSRMVRMGGVQNDFLGSLARTLNLIDTPFRYSSFYDSIDLDLGAATEDVENAAKIGLNFYGELLTNPSPGRYCYYDETDDVDPQFNINEKVTTSNGLFVPDDVYYRDQKLGECRKEVARVHGVDGTNRYALRLTATKPDDTTYQITAEHTPSSNATRIDVAKGLLSKLESKLNGNSNFQSFSARRVKTDVVAETFGSFKSWSFEVAPTNQTGDEMFTTMSSPHDLQKGTGEFFGYKTTPEYNYRINRVGTYIDKLYAGTRMFQLNADFTFAEFATDVRATNISYWTEYPDAIYDLVHGIFLGDFAEFGGGYSPSNDAYETWNLVGFEQDNNSEPLRGTEMIGGVSPGMPTDTWPFLDSQSFSTRQRVLLLALVENSTWQDKVTDFDEYTVVAATEKERQNLPDEFTKVKNGETVLTKEGKKRTIEFVHPTTNRTYIAVAVEGPNGENRSITYDLLAWAKEVKKQYQNASSTPGPEEELSPKEKYREDLENIVARVNLIRQIRSYYSPEG